MAAAEYTPSYSGVGEMLNAAWMVGEMRARGQAVMDEVEATAPVYDGPSGDPHRGRYKDSFRLEAKDHGGAKGDRAAAYVWNDSPEAAVVEFGFAPTAKRPRGQVAHRTLRNALDAAGD
jgi:hypothetical protein